MESTDDYDVVTRRRPRQEDEAPDEPTAVDDEPRMDPFGLLSGTEEAEPQTPEPRSTQQTGPEPGADESTAWLLDQLPDPPTDPQSSDPDPEAARSPSQTETTLPGRRFGGAPAGAPHPAPSEPVQHRPRSEPSRFDPEPRGNTMRIAIAATEFNYDITSMMLERARAHADVLGAEVSHIVRVPGVYDLPLAAKRLMARGDVDGVVALGCVIEGETDHDDLVIQHAARKLIDLSLESDKPVGLGITGPGMSRLQAMSRIDRAKDAVEAAIRMHRELAAL